MRESPCGREKAWTVDEGAISGGVDVADEAKGLFAGGNMEKPRCR